MHAKNASLSCQRTCSLAKSQVNKRRKPMAIAEKHALPQPATRATAAMPIAGKMTLKIPNPNASQSAPVKATPRVSRRSPFSKPVWARGNNEEENGEDADAAAAAADDDDDDEEEEEEEESFWSTGRDQAKPLAARSLLELRGHGESDSGDSDNGDDEVEASDEQEQEIEKSQRSISKNKDTLVLTST
jgi:hypothetical protein